MTTDRKTNARVLAGSIFAAALILSVTAIWVTLRLTEGSGSPGPAGIPGEGLPTSVTSTSARPGTRGSAHTVGSAAARPHEEHTAPQALAQETFSEVWDGPLRDQAEEECFGPHDATGEPIESNPFFTVIVGEDGRVESVSFGPEGERFGDLFPCVAKLVEQVQLPAGPRRTGRVQAARPQR